jgi:ankyrin repeat protein
VNRPQADGTTALHWAVQNNDVELVDDAAARGSRRHSQEPLRPSSDRAGATNGSVAAIDALLKAGADPNTTTEAGEPVLMTAARSGSVDAVKALLAAGAHVNAREAWFGETALMWAAAENHGDVVRALVAGGAEVNARSTVLDPPVLEFPAAAGRTHRSRAAGGRR